MSNKSIYIPNGGDKYIKLSQALEVLDSCSCWYAHDRMEMIPAADVVERKHGKWVLKTFYDGYGEYQLYECNLCGAVTAQRKSKNYCHNCGAKMESEE